MPTNERELFERHAERVLQFFVNKVRAPVDANDLAQEAFARFFERLRAGDVEHERAFLFGVANNVLREYWKKARRQFDEFDPGDRSIVEMGAAKTSLSSMFARRQGHQQMLDAMRHLRLDYQNVLELRYWHELRYAEIAEVLGQNERTVGVWLRRAKDDLIEVLKRLPSSSDDVPQFSPHALDEWLRGSGELAREAGRRANNGSGPAA